MNPLDQFRHIYITECFELLTQMETELLDLDASADSEKLNAIFRCAHSIKGGAGAFDFTAIAQFTHTLEALLDRLREGELTVTRELTDMLLQARDVVWHMVTAARDNEPLPPQFGDDIEAQLKSMVNTEHTTPQAIQPTPTSSAATQHYLIRFIPHPTLLASGNEPLLLLRELQKLGEAQIECNTANLPDFALLQPDICYLSWDIILKTHKGESAIREVFEFVEDLCDLHITLQNLSSPQTDTTTPNTPEHESKKSLTPTATSIRVDIDKVDRLINMVGEIVIIQAMMSMQSRFLPAQQFPQLLHGIEELTQHTRELQEAVMAVRMQPVKSIFARMPRLVRDLSAQLGKDIKLETTGEATEVDKTIIEQLSDPLTHMIRNAVDHGIESPATRIENGKPPQGTITLTAEHKSGKIVITLSDDGGGISRQKVLAKAKEKGVISPDAQLSDTEIDMLIFAPGFSTAESVTSVSGRGVGMDVVKRNIESLGGTVHLHNQPGTGSQFVIALPLTLAILDGMVVRVVSEHYIIAIANIIETMRPKKEEVRSMADGNTVINVRGAFVPVLYLHQLFAIPNAITDASQGLVVLVENGESTLGLVVDELVGQQQVVIKSLEENADAIDGVSGATILGDGKVSLILDIAGLHRMKQPAHHTPSLAA